MAKRPKDADAQLITYGLDPILQLAAGVAAQAIKDLDCNNTIHAVDALIWWLEEGPIWLENMNIESKSPLERILR